MATLDDLKKRIASVKSTQKITKAMKMVAAAKLKRAQENAEKGRPYAEKMNNIILNLTSGISDKENAPRLLFGSGKEKVHLCVVLTSDRGLCGGFNTSIIKKAKAYFEKILKGAKVGLWTRNLQLAFYSVLVGYGKLASSPQGEALRAGRTSFFFGYTKMTWCCVALNAFGGLLVGTVIKYADAVMKDVALGSSIVCSSLASVYLFDFELNASFAAGIACVIYSVFLYGQRAHCCGGFPR